MRRALIAAALIAASPALAAGKMAVSKNESVALALDEVHTLTFRAPVSTVYVGNPTIADVTMIDARHAFVQGKGYGRTNLVALNRDNVQVFNSRITVTGNDGGGTVTLNRGAQRVTLNCAGGRLAGSAVIRLLIVARHRRGLAAAAHQAAARGVAAAEARASN
jgi:Flp pilus assembly secretin CpaC